MKISKLKVGELYRVKEETRIFPLYSRFTLNSQVPILEKNQILLLINNKRLRRGDRDSVTTFLTKGKIVSFIYYDFISDNFELAT